MLPLPIFKHILAEEGKNSNKISNHIGYNPDTNTPVSNHLKPTNLQVYKVENDGKIYNIIEIPEGTLLFNYVKTTDPTNSYPYKIAEPLDDNLNIDSNIVLQKDQLFFYPTTHWAIGIGMNFYGSMVYATSKTIKLLCLIRPASKSRSSYFGCNHQDVKRCNCFVDSAGNNGGQPFDICLNLKLKLGLDLDGTIGIAGQDSFFSGSQTAFRDWFMNSQNLNNALYENIKNMLCYQNDRRMEWSDSIEENNGLIVGLPEIVLFPYNNNFLQNIKKTTTNNILNIENNIDLQIENLKYQIDTHPDIVMMKQGLNENNPDVYVPLCKKYCNFYPIFKYGAPQTLVDTGTQDDVNEHLINTMETWVYENMANISFDSRTGFFLYNTLTDPTDMTITTYNDPGDGNFNEDNYVYETGTYLGLFGISLNSVNWSINYRYRPRNAGTNLLNNGVIEIKRMILSRVGSNSYPE